MRVPVRSVLGDVEERRVVGVRVLSGATRHVFRIGSWAAKLPRLDSWRTFLVGLLANIQEAEFSPLSAKLAKVRFALPGGFFLLMDWCEPVPLGIWLRLDVEAWKRDGTELNLPVENKLSSFGLDRRGEVVAVDYGS